MIYNPRAGPANLAATIELVADFWRARDWQVVVQPTQKIGHATELAAAAAAAGHRLVLAAGGDGTLGEVANGLAGTETVMAPVPAGTANSFAKELLMPRPGLGTPQRLLHAVSTLAAGTVQRMDLGYTVGVESEEGTNGRHWLLWSGAGVDGFLVEELEPRPTWSKRLGMLGWTLQAISVAHRLPQMQAKVTIDDVEYEGEYALVLVSNCRRYAGGEMLISPGAQLDDGLFEVWIFHGCGFRNTVKHLVRGLRGTHIEHPDVQLVHGRSITIHTTPEMPCQTDGDKAGSTPLSVTLKPGALQMLIPNTAPADLFGKPGETL